jgi:hypothetical protein
MSTNKVTKVTIEVGTDDQSIERARNQIQNLIDTLDSYQGAASNVTANRNRFGGAQPPSPPSGPDGPSGPSLPGGGYYRAAPGGGLPIPAANPISGNVSSVGSAIGSISIQANLVQIVAATVYLNGSISGGLGPSALPGVGGMAAGIAGGGDALGQDALMGFGNSPFTRGMSRFAAILHQSGVPWDIATHLASKAPASLTGWAGLAVAGGGLLVANAASQGVTAYRSAANQQLDTMAGFGQAAMAGQFTSTREQVFNAVQDPRLEGNLAFTKSVGLFQIADLLTFGTLGRREMELRRQQDLTARAAQARSDLNIMREIGVDDVGSIITFEEARKRLNAGQADGNVNDMVSRSLAAYNTPLQAARYRMARSGLIGYANLTDLNPSFSTSPESSEMKVNALIGGVGNLSAAQRTRALFGGSNAVDALSGVLLSLLKGDASPGVRMLLKENGVDLESQATLFGQMAGAQERMAVGQSGAGYFASQARYQAASGYSASAQAASMRAGVGSLQNARSALVTQRDMLAAVGASPVTIAQMNEQIMSMDASIAEQTKAASSMVYDETLSIAGSRISGAGSAVQLSAYRGVAPGANGNYNIQIQNAQLQAQTLRNKLADPAVRNRMTPSEIAQLQAEIESADLRVVEYQRGQMMAQYQFGQSGVSVRSAGVSAAVQRASRFGSASGIFEASQGQLGVIDEQLRLEREMLDEMRRGKGTLAERNAIEARIVNLTAQREMVEEDNLRARYSGMQSLSATRQQAIDTRRADVEGLYGSGAAMGMTRGSLSMVRDRLSRNRAEQERLRSDPRMDPDGQRLAELQAEEQGLISQDLAHMDQLATYREDLPTRRYRRRLGMAAQIIQRTHAGYGSVRGIYQAQMGLAGRTIERINAQRQQALASATSQEERDRINEMADQQVASAFSEAVDAQSNLEMGWQERLISSVYGGGGNFNMVASNFTRREASAFYGIANRAFGGNYAQSAAYRQQGSLWYQSFARSANRGAFIDKAMMGRDTVEMVGSLDINVHVVDEAGRTIGQTKVVANAGNQVRANLKRGESG